MNSMVDIQSECIGTLAVYPELFKHCILKAEYFTEGYRQIFEAMSSCYHKNDELITAEMAKTKEFDVDLYIKCSETGFSGDLKRFNKIQRLVIDSYKKRRIQSLTEGLNNNTINLNEYDTKYREIIDLHISETSRITLDDLIEACKDDKKNICFRRFKHLGALMKLKENDLVIVAGATGSGKSGFALNLLEDLSEDYKCLYFNLEMVPQELLQRLIAIKSGIKLDNVPKINKLSQNEQNNGCIAMNELASNEIHIISQSQTIDTIRSTIASNTSDKHVIVIIDHIGLIGTKARNSYERMTEIAKELRKYSLDYNCTIIGLCQLNREALKSGTEPRLSMLRDSGEIEQSASKVLFVWHDDENYSLVLEKNRSGALGLVDINYDKSSQRMEEVN